MSGGGGGSSQPTQQNVTQTNIPKELMPYAMQTLGKAQELTNQPYQSYQGPQVAGFSDMQNQAFQGVGNQQVAGELNDASGLASMAGQRAGQVGSYDPTQFGYQGFGNQSAQDYMSPYMQNVVEMQKQGAVQDYARSIPGMGANAARMGGLGGSRNAIVQAEAQRNLGNTMGNIQATGSQAAFQNAQQQFNADQMRRLQTQQAGEQSRQFGANLGMQGLQQQLAAAGMLGNIGSMRYGQESGINQARLSAGSLQQQQQQRQYDQDMQNFANAQNYPYKQLGFMSDLVRGTPTGSSVQSVYGGQPSTLGQVAGLGLGIGSLYGAPK